MTTEYVRNTDSGDDLPSVGATPPAPVFVPLGPRPEEDTLLVQPGAPRSYPDEAGARLDADAAEIIARYPHPRSALLPLLHLVQSEDGYITPAGIEFCARHLELSGAEVAAVATFYTMYRRKPTGRYHVGVCTNALCAVMGGDEIYGALREHLAVGNGETTDDGAITLEHIECNAACDFAPVMTVNWELFDNRTVRSAVELVDALRDGTPAVPTRGAPLCSFRETARLLAGFPDTRPGVLEAGGSAGEASLAGLRIARAHDMAAPPPPRDDALPQSRDASGATGTPLTPVLTSYWDDDRSWTLDTYRRHHGYEALPLALGMEPDAVVGAVKDSGLRGRGGAGFSTGTKWSFIPQGDDKPHYLVVNADESEPGTCKDIPFMYATPHALIEGVIIAAYAIRARHAFIYLRGEAVPVLRRLHAAVAEAYGAGYLGADILGSGYDLDVVVHAGAGAYICGEETALLDSLEGRRGQPRLRPPFPAVAGLYASPTVVNNVESIANVPPIIRNGVEWYRSMGTEKSPGFALFSLSGHVTTPGQYEAPLGITLRELLEYAGGVRAGHRLKFWTPGGSSTPIFTDEHLDIPLDYESVGAAGSMLGTRALQIFDETTCVVRTVLRWSEFYAHESCGKCTPCREGTWWLVQILDRLEHGRGTEEDLAKLLDISDNILGRAFCALGDGATSPITSSIGYFRDEYLAHFEHGGCPFDPHRATLAAGASREGETR
ncbi:NADH-quinone oxidoreductase subunit NuoF [Rhodococcus chondri]|uniref:NADH-quinone oxidoreductase subunit NuoF n=1 Tax=Rhodococcus chondri TaxID=3065941 RepID=A0ABU7JYL1_9NOCA|nr:NADH-quinone oxidoreductase subunit NuoF [Rhodococcus sp. CC-R104]MEE2035105.1 NADH-quinone oxidoreductase subunit NuoF [Rhodococcus sp. CC-R104]